MSAPPGFGVSLGRDLAGGTISEVRIVVAPVDAEMGGGVGSIHDPVGGNQYPGRRVDGQILRSTRTLGTTTGKSIPRRAHGNPRNRIGRTITRSLQAMAGRSSRTRRSSSRYGTAPL